jgi:16S rRNA (guanine(966)-N(2))-methyltransferase RsmD
MRIISGIYKGRRLQPPTDIKARPTTDFAKESLFNVLNNYIDFEEIEVLDLFSGTGSIALEFISRGCIMATAIEIEQKHCNFINNSCKILNINNLSVFRTDVFGFLQQCNKQYDLIFADPPYTLKELPLLPELVMNLSVLKPEGLFILEHSAKNNFNKHPYFSEHRKYGNVNFSFFKALSV